MKLSNFRNLEESAVRDPQCPHSYDIVLSAVVTVTTGMLWWKVKRDRPIVLRTVIWQFDDAVAEYPPQSRINRLFAEYERKQFDNGRAKQCAKLFSI